MSARIDAFLQLGREQGCSDLHLAVGYPPMLRVMGEIGPIHYRDLTEDELKSFIYEVLSEPQREWFEAGNDLDFCYSPTEAERYRFNVFRKREGVGAAIRIVPSKIPSFADLGLPPIVSRLAQSPSGLLLVTGPTGSGKTTTLAAIVNMLNETKALNIITIEDPVEFVHKSKASLVVQREVGTSVPSFADGLRSALREDPDVILAGELRDADTIMMAITAAETGHLVLGTLHTMSAVKTIDRIIDLLPEDAKRQGAMLLAQHLRGVISQTLIVRPTRQSRRAIAEVLVMTPAIANLILTGKTIQIPALMMTGRDQGMCLMDQVLLEAVQAKEIDPDAAYMQAQDKKLLQRFVTDPKLLPQVSLVGR
jgi:twitching motility protein PilT